MKVSYNWIRELVDVEWAPEEMAHRLTLAGTACESIVPLSERFEHMVVGEILEVKAIPGADRIRLAQVDIGSDKLSIICGAPNLETGQKAAVAKLGAALPGGLKVEALSKFGVESRGMLLSEAELELSEDHRGIMVIPGEFKPGDPLAQALQLDDYSLEFELTPNRPDSMSAIGIARDVAALSGKRIRRPEWSLSESGGKTADNIQVEIEDPDFCPRYAARIVKNVVIKQAPQWMRARLLASGVTPINNVVDVTNYVLLETGQPLHAFDLSHFSTGKVVVKRASGKQKYTTLDGIEREVDESVLMITNGPEYLAAGGVMGGLKSSITETTTDVLLESAYFEPSLIRKSRKKLGLSTDASARFERGVDPNGTALAINRAAQLLSETADGSVCDGVVDSYVKKIAPRKINLRPERVNQILGTQIQTPEIVDILRGLEFEVQNGDILNVTAPTFRPDVEREIDLIEEVVRIHGIDRIPNSTGYLAFADQGEAGPAREHAATLETLRRTLLAAGFDEVIGSGLADKRLLEALDPGRKRLILENPVSDEFAALRNSLVYSLLSAARTNITRQVTSIRLFEIGPVYGPNLAGECHERSILGALVSGKSEPFWRSKDSTDLDYYVLKGALERLCQEARINEFTIRPENLPPFGAGVGFHILSQGKVIGRIGALKEELTRKFDIKQPVSTLEVDIPALLQSCEPPGEYRPIPRFPASDRDISMIIDESTEIGSLLGGIQSMGDGLIEAVSLFDLFRGRQIPAGKKSAAISIRFRSAEKSLESSEVDGLQRGIIDYLKREFKADIRDH